MSSLRGRLTAFVVKLCLAVVTAKKSPEKAADMTRRSLWRMSQHDWKTAELYGEAAVRTNPGSPDAYRAAALAYAGARQFARARELLTNGARIAPDDPRFPSDLGDVEAAIERWPEAVEAYRRAVEIEPESALFRIRLASALFRNDELTESLSVIRQASERHPDDAAVHAELGHILARAGMLEQAEQVLVANLDRNPNSALTHYYLAVAYVWMRRWTEALERARRARELDGNLINVASLIRGLEATLRTGIEPVAIDQRGLS